IEDLNIKPHNLHSHTYKSPHFCDLCGEMLFGLIKQGLKCDGCHMNFHKRCSDKIPNNCNNLKFLQHSSGSSDQEAMETDENQTTLAKTISTSTKSSSRSQKNRSKSWNGRPLWMEKEYASRIKVPHTFVAHTYTRPTVCQHCKKLLKGFIRQGMQCKNCKFNCHARCTSLTPVNCPGEIQRS
ncbi:hypothetical protein HELRODRAFT_73871, partial [Helobdella robusta]|uniref:Phorbol-ester/DAG-type domain-containing protein n=1 Tax=Helobdella robusta TaxID=6412 RepID=T1G1J7_HELRO